MNRLKKILCKHKWEYLEKPKKIRSSYEMAKIYCVKCEKRDYKKVNKWKMNPTNYCWCPKCGNDVARDSFVSNNQGLVVYKCSRCNHESTWDFTIAPIPILLGDEEDETR